MGLELFKRDKHVCVMFTDLVGGDDGGAVQANQILIVDHGHGMLLDPGGTMTYNELFVSLSRYVPPKELQYVFASHQDPDIVASLQRWLTSSQTTLLVSRLWDRFVPHFCQSGKTLGRIVGIPDRGGVVTLGKAKLQILPAHFLHAEGNLQVYDPVSRILFSGDLGASIVPAARAAQFVDDLPPHLPAMTGFHRRYMVSNKVCKLWAQMARALDIEMIVPQHGAPIRGKRAVDAFIDWIAALECGIDLMSASDYRAPDASWEIDAASASATATAAASASTAASAR